MNVFLCMMWDVDVGFCGGEWDSGVNAYETMVLGGDGDKNSVTKGHHHT